MPERVARRDGPELVIGLVGAVGTDLPAVSNALSEALADVGYRSTAIGLSGLLQGIARYRTRLTRARFEDERINRHMDAGNDFRKRLGQGDALAVLSLGRVRRER